MSGSEAFFRNDYWLSAGQNKMPSVYYRTVTEEFAATRPAFRWRHLVALARVTASMYGYDRNGRRGHRAPGYEQACKLLGVG